LETLISRRVALVATVSLAALAIWAFFNGANHLFAITILLALAPITFRWPVVAALAAGPLIVWALSEGLYAIVAFLVLVVLAPVAIRWPLLAVAAYVFLIPFETVTAVADLGGSTITRFFGIAAAGGLLANALVQRKLVRPPLIALGVALLFGWS